MQKYALNVYLKSWNSDYDDLLCESKLPKLETRRIVARLCHMYKIIHDLTDFPNSPVRQRVLSYDSRSVNSISLVPVWSSTSLYKFSFFPHVITLWNKIVVMFNILECDTLNSFKLFLYIIINDQGATAPQYGCQDRCACYVST